MANELPITLNIAGRPYRLTISRDEEEIVRKAAKNIENLVNHYANNYRYSDKQDLMAMVALHYATLAQHAQNEASYIANRFTPVLNELDKILDESLKD
jgi:cell division protein ZapA